MYVWVEFTDGSVPRFPGAYASIPFAIFIYALYLGLSRWSGPGLALAWLLMPALSVAATFGIAYATDGAVIWPLVAAVATFGLTVAAAERMRR